MNQLERILIIHHLLKHKRALSTKELEDILEVSRATVHRDVEYMRDRLKAPIVYNRQEPQGFMYDPEVDFDFPGLWITSTELYMIFYLGKIFEQMFPDFIQHLLSPMNIQIQDKIHGFLVKTGIYPDKLFEKLSIFADRPANIDPLILENLTKATIDNKKITLIYHDDSTSTKIKKDLNPIHIVYYKCHWHLLASENMPSTENQAFKMIDVALIENLEIKNQTFEPLNKEFVKTKLNHAFGINPDGTKPLKKAKLRFSKRLSALIRKEHWHDAQRGELSKSGNFILEIPYKEEDLLIRTILEYGDDVKIIEPEELSTKLVQKLYNTLKLYNQS